MKNGHQPVIGDEKFYESIIHALDIEVPENDPGVQMTSTSVEPITNDEESKEQQDESEETTIPTTSMKTTTTEEPGKIVINCGEECEKVLSSFLPLLKEGNTVDRTQDEDNGNIKLALSDKPIDKDAAKKPDTEIPSLTDEDMVLPNDYDRNSIKLNPEEGDYLSPFFPSANDGGIPEEEIVSKKPNNQDIPTKADYDYEPPQTEPSQTEELPQTAQTEPQLTEEAPLIKEAPQTEVPQTNELQQADETPTKDLPQAEGAEQTEETQQEIH